MRGKILIFLHAHLPYVHHPEYDHFLEERWLFEAITETYIPLLMMFDEMEDFRLTMSITPPLMEMLSSRDLQEKYERHMEKLIELADKEVERTKKEHPLKHKMAKFYREHFEKILNVFRSYNGNILEGFRKHQETGKLEIVTCNATHAFLPLYQMYPEVVNAQITVGVKNYEKHMKKHPRGIWLAECGYYQGLDLYLAQNNVEYFFVDSHAFWFADEQPRYGVYRPIMTPSGVFAFARDPESSEQVWSAAVGYPGDPRYREFYRDIGFDREMEYIKDYIDPSGVRINTGIKYHRITSKSLDASQKEYYDIDLAMEAVEEHARDFLHKKENQARRLMDIMGVEPVIVAPFDAELFGHWWFEGVFFLKRFFELVNESKDLKLVTASEVIDTLEEVQIATPADSSWGAGGYYETWLNGTNDWIYRHLHEMIERMIDLSKKCYNSSDPLVERVLNQMLRELFLAQSSDWAFIMTTRTSVQYAENRTKLHIKRFLNLYDQLVSGRIDEEMLRYYEWTDAIFPEINFRVMARDVI
jgi:1,4-alpha-glucan branching enzyme